MAKKPKHRRPKAKPGAWFVPLRGSYLPVSPAGWLTYIPFVAYLFLTLKVGLIHTSSAAAAVLFIVSTWALALAVMTYIAAKKS